MKMTVTAKTDPTESFWKNVERTANETEDEMELRVMHDGICPYCNHEHCVCGVINEKKSIDWSWCGCWSPWWCSSLPSFPAPVHRVGKLRHLRYEVVFNALKNLFKGKLFDENFLLAVASIGAIALGDYREAAAVMLFYEVGEYFQDKAVESSRKNIADMMDLKSDTALVVADGKETVTPAKTSPSESIVKVKNGEKIPLDGIVKSGTSFLDTKSITENRSPAR
jgi:Cd2+/Zn2+-exporting ATPase